MLQTKSIYYGWVIVGCCGLMYFSGIGLTINITSVYLASILEILELTTQQTSSLVMVQTIASLAAILLSYSLYKIISIRKGVFFVGLLLSLGYFSMAFATDIWGFYFSMALIGVGYGAGSIIPATIILNRWFFQKRGFVFGISASFSGIATILFPPLITAITGTLGFVYACCFQGVVIVLVNIIIFFLVRDFPMDKGLCAYGLENIVPGAGVNDYPFKTSKGIWKRKEFYHVLIAGFLIGCTLCILTHMAVLIMDAGHSAMIAATAISVYGISMLFGKPIYGHIVDKFGLYKSNIYIYASYAVLLILGYYFNASVIIVYVFAINFGLSAALNSMAPSIWIRNLFGESYYLEGFSWVFLLYIIGGVIGNYLPGIVAKVTGSYRDIFLITVIIVGVSYFFIQHTCKKSIEV